MRRRAGRYRSRHDRAPPLRSDCALCGQTAVYSVAECLVGKLPLVGPFPVVGKVHCDPILTRTHPSVRSHTGGKRWITRPARNKILSKVVMCESPPSLYRPCTPPRAPRRAEPALDQPALVVGQGDARPLREHRPDAVVAVRQRPGGAAGCGEPVTARRAGARRRPPGPGPLAGRPLERPPEAPAVVS